MSILGTLSRRQSSVPSKSLNACSRIAHDLPQLIASGDRGETSRRTTRRPGFDAVNTRRKHAPGLEDVFIRSLVAAGQCRQHKADESGRWQQGARGWRQTKDQRMNVNGGRRFLSTTSKDHEAAMVVAQEDPDAMPVPEITKEEYKDMVNMYGLPSDMWDKPAFGLQPPSSRKRKQHNPLAPRLVVSPEQESKPPYTERVVLEPQDEKHASLLERLYRALAKEPGTASLNRIWHKYTFLPTPRLRYMSDKMIRRLFGHLTWVENAHSDARTRRRYFTLLEDCVGEQIPLTAVEWSAAMNFAGRAVKHGTDNEVKDAVELWLKMEESGVKANNVTFNILFYVAVKAGRFALADTIYNELVSRNMELDRYFRASMIYYAGTKGDGDAVRKAFNDMVNAGEIIDTTVMNCVVLSFIRAGEPEAADHVFRKMKALHESKFGSNYPEDWRARRKMGKLLNETGQRLRAERKDHENSFFGAHYSSDDKREQIQEATPIAPDARTYRLLLRYNTRVSGDLDRVRELLEENKERGFRIHGSVYLNIFSAFIIHGGYVHSAWKPSILESYWRDFLEASSAPNAGQWLSSGENTIQMLDFDAAPPLDDAEAFAGPDGLMEMEEDDQGPDLIAEEDRPPCFTLGLAITVLRAFHKCCGMQRTIQVWNDIASRWKECGREETVQIETLLEDLQRRDLGGYL
jgi:pentatricopeptide repeat protein